MTDEDMTNEGVTAIKDFVDKKKDDISKKIPEFSAKEGEEK